MKPIRHRLRLLALACVCCLPPAGASAGDDAKRAPLVLPNAEQRLMTSSVSGREYLVYVAAPSGPAAGGGYPVIYVLDANAMFLTAVEAARAYERRRDEERGVQALVVGIGYPPGTDIDRARTHDLSPEVDDPRGRSPTGGAAALRAFIERDLKPAIARDYPVDPTRQALMGHSLAGMFTLATLVETPAAFQTYVAMSSSFWFDGHALAARIRDFAASRSSGDAPVRVLLTAGELEERVRPRALARDPERAAETLATLRSRGQVRYARRAAGDLARAPETLVDFREIAGEDHGTVIPAAIARGVDFILAGPAAVPPVPSAGEYVALGAEGRDRLCMQVRALPDLHRIPWLRALRASLKKDLDAATRERLRDERESLDERYGG